MLKVLKNNSGISLVEVILVVIIGLIVSIISFNTFVTVSRASNDLNDLAFTSNEAQTLAQTIDNTVRNSDIVMITKKIGGIQYLFNRRYNSVEDTWSCEGWAFSENNEGAVYHSTEVTNFNSSQDLSTWNKIIDGGITAGMSDDTFVKAPLDTYTGLVITPNVVNYSFVIQQNSLSFAVTSSTDPSIVAPISDEDMCLH